MIAWWKLVGAAFVTVGSLFPELIDAGVPPMLAAATGIIIVAIADCAGRVILEVRK